VSFHRFYLFIFFFLDSSTHSWIVTGITKILARSTQPNELFKEVDTTLLNMEARQRLVFLFSKKYY